MLHIGQTSTSDLHNKNTIIFVAVLLYDETATSFEWLFKRYLHTKNAKEPQTILTDQDKAMQNAISSVMPMKHYRIFA